MLRYKSLFFFSVAILATLNAFAGRKYQLLDTVYQIDKKANFKKLRVIDMRSSKADVLYIQSGPSAKSTHPISNKPLSDLLPECYQQITANTGTNDEKELLLVLYSFDVHDRPNGGETGAFYFDGDFFAFDNGNCNYLGTIDSLIEVGGGFYGAKQLTRAAGHAVCSYLGHYALQLPAGMQSYTEPRIVQRRKEQKIPYPIYQTTNYRKGIYYTPEQFLNNAPADTSFVSEVYYEGGYRRHLLFYTQNKKGGKGERIKEKNFFAIYDGKEWAVTDKPYAVTLRYINGEFYAIKSFKGVVPGAGSGAAMFGLMGALIDAAADDGGSVGWALYNARFNPETKEFKPVGRK